MQAITLRPGTASLRSGNSFQNRQSSRGVVVRAAEGDARKDREQKVVKQVISSTFAAIAAVSLTFAGPATASNNAFDLSKGKDDELLGNAFEKIGVPGNGPKEADDLRKKVGLKPQGDQTGQEENKLKKLAQNNAFDLSKGKDDELLGNAFEKIGVPGNGPKEADDLRKKVGLKPQGDQTGQEENKLKKLAKNNAFDLSKGKDDELLGNAFEKIGVPGNGPKEADDLRKKVGLKPQGDQTGQEENKLKKLAQNNAFDLSKGKDDELLGNAFEKIGVPGNGPKEADDLRKKVGLKPQGDQTGQEENKLKKLAKNNAFDLSKGKDDELLGNAFEKIGVPGNGPKEADDLRKKVGLKPQGDQTGQEENKLKKLAGK
ncbi:hypothetical protein WJX73_007676 [Symbiochloris irregularis]|uniref:Uncharacterized protein n=1 Tax=Symbiochloris irregularis TaxID=706552 RepID=A0AAW1PR70_9CHLO